VTKLPVTVTAVTPVRGQLYAVTVVFSDATTGRYLIPQNMATIEAVSVSATVMAMLCDLPANQLTAPHHDPRRLAATP